MNFLDSIKSYIFFFYVMGLTPCLTDAEPTVKKLTLGNIMKYLWFALCVCLTAVHFRRNIRDPVSDKLTISDVIFINLDLIFELLRAASVLAQCLFYKRYFYEINYNLRKIESYFYIHFRHRISDRPFKVAFKSKVAVVFAAYFQYMIGRTIHFGIASQFRILQALTLLTFLHIIFYIDVLSFHVQQMNIVIKRDVVLQRDVVQQSDASTSNANRIQFRNQLSALKLIHFQVWLLACRVNEAFGWVLIALSIYAFFDFVFCIFWFYEDVKMKANLWEIISMWTEIGIQRKLQICCFYLFLGPISRSFIISISTVTLVYSSQILIDVVNGFL